MSVFSERLKNCRKEKGLLQDGVAESLGISKKTYSTYETGRSEPSIALLSDLSSFFNVSADYLIGRVDDPTEILEISTFAASSDIPINELSEESKRELENYAKYLLATQQKPKP